MDEKRFPEFAKYFNELLKVKRPKVPQDKIADELGIKQGTISKIKRGVMLPGDELAERISTIWEVVDMMKKLDEAREHEGKTNKYSSRHAEEEKKLKPRLPVNAAAGKLSDYLGGVLAHECEMLPIIRHFPDYDFTMIVKGNSMEPKFEGGDEIACKQVNSVIKWGESYVLATRDGAVLKRLYPHDNGVRCVSYNGEEYPDFVVNADDILAVYKVVGLLRTE